MQEFRTVCRVVQDSGMTLARRLSSLKSCHSPASLLLCVLQEFSHHHGSFGLATVTCFVPSLPAGAHYYISIHSWNDPKISHFTRSYSKHPELVQFEARIIVDGRLIAYVN